MNTTGELILIKGVLERHFEIFEWYPSLNQIQIMVDKIRMLDEEATDKDVYTIIHQVYPDEFSSAGMEGLDTSKAHYLLSQLDSTKKEETSKEENK